MSGSHVIVARGFMIAIGPDNSLLGGVIGAAVLLGVNAVVVRVIGANEKVAQVMEGTPTVLAKDGDWDIPALRREGLRKADIARLEAKLDELLSR